MTDLSKLDYSQEWVDEKRRHNIVVRIIENYRQKQTEIEELYRMKRTRFN